MRLLIPLLIFMLAFPATLLADEPPTEPQITGIKKGEEAPYSGVLLNSLAAAKLFTEKNYSKTECDLRISYELDKELARVNLLLETTKVSMDALEERYGSLLTIKDTEIARLSKIAADTNDNSKWWAGGGVLVGIGLTIAVVYAIEARP